MVYHIRFLFAVGADAQTDPPEHLYVDFDGFFASCEEPANPLSPVRLSYRGHSVSICAQ